MNGNEAMYHCVGACEALGIGNSIQQLVKIKNNVGAPRRALGTEMDIKEVGGIATSRPARALGIENVV